MTGVIRKATILVALGLLAASAAMAGLPDAGHCTVPAYMKVVGSSIGAGVPDVRGTFTVTVRDVGNLPVSGSVVTLNFSLCTDMKICDRAGQTCSPSVVTATANSAGVATFIVVGGGLHPGGTGFAGLATPCISVRADGYFLGNAFAQVYDLNGARGVAGTNGVLITDLPLWLADWNGGAGAYKARSDYNGLGTVGITDLPLWLGVWGPAASAGGCTTTYCP